MSGIYNCSIEAGKEYEATINEYLKSKGIKDFSKYHISFDEDKLHFSEWDYPNIDKLIDKKPRPITINYQDLYPRLLTIKITYNEKFKLYNVDGDEIIDHTTYKDKQNRSFQMILQENKLENNKWNTYNNRNKDIYIWEGMLTFDHKIIGEYHVIILYRYNPPNTLKSVSYSSQSDREPHPPEDTLSINERSSYGTSSIKDSQKFYTMPKDLLS